MRPHPRIRAAVQWGGLFLTLLLAAAWLVSVRWCVAVSAGPIEVSLGSGVIGVGWEEPWSWPGGLFWGVASAEPLTWWFGFEQTTFWINVNRAGPPPAGWTPTLTHTRVSAPIWCLALLSAVSSVAGWRAARQGMCDRCSYPRAGLAVGAPCPECGSAPTGAKP